MLMSVFSSGGIGIDLGSANAVVYLENQGVVLREPACALVNRDNSGDVIALGREARRLLGRTGEDAIMVSPVSDGGVADQDLAAMLLLSAAEKASEKRRPFEKSRLAVSVPHGATRVERAALASAIGLAGAKRAIMVKSGVAAALGAGVRIDRPQGVLVISVGSSLTEISILSMNGVVASRTMKAGSLAFDEAIVRYVRRVKGLVIGMSTAEDLKKDIGTAKKPENGAEVLLRGRHVVTGKPSTESVNASDVYLALNEPIRAIVESVCDALYNVPPELTGDILDSGIYLTGGGALLDGFADRLKSETQLTVNVSAHPEDDTAIGVGRVACDDRLARALVNAFSAYEV